MRFHDRWNDQNADRGETGEEDQRIFPSQQRGDQNTGEQITEPFDDRADDQIGVRTEDFIVNS